MTLDQDTGATLAILAERERRGGYVQGLGLLESSLLERGGDHVGSVFAAYMELAYLYGWGQIDVPAIQSRLAALDARYASIGGASAQQVLAATRAIRSYLRGDWREAVAEIDGLPHSDKPTFYAPKDSFARWMRLTALAETRPLGRTEMDEYSMMQSRYALFPEYWYRFARFETSVELRRDSAERCISLSTNGPFAKEARGIIAESYGLKRSDGISLLIRPEIESLASNAVRTGNPAELASLLPLLGLPDNPLTLYAVGTLKGLSSIAEIRSWLEAQAAKQGGRTGERLRYAAGR